MLCACGVMSLCWLPSYVPLAVLAALSVQFYRVHSATSLLVGGVLGVWSLDSCASHHPCFRSSSLVRPFQGVLAFLSVLVQAFIFSSHLFVNVSAPGSTEVCCDPCGGLTNLVCFLFTACVLRACNRGVVERPVPMGFAVPVAHP